MKSQKDSKITPLDLSFWIWHFLRCQWQIGLIDFYEQLTTKVVKQTNSIAYKFLFSVLMVDSFVAIDR